MHQDNGSASCESDLVQIADEFHRLYIANPDNLRNLILQWNQQCVQEENQPRHDPATGLLPLPQRELTLEEKVVSLAAIHDKLWKGELINPFPIDDRSAGLAYLKAKEASRRFRKLMDGVLAIPKLDLLFLNEHLNSAKNALIPGRESELYPARNDLWCRWFKERKWTDAEIRDRWNLMTNDERQTVDSRGWGTIDPGPRGAKVVGKVRSRRGVKRKETND